MAIWQPSNRGRREGRDRLGARPGVVRVVFDTNTVISGLLFSGSLSWLFDHWRAGVAVPLASRATASELLRVLRYPKFGLSEGNVEEIVDRCGFWGICLPGTGTADKHSFMY